ncbi:MAG: 16S rRNA (uracil(1498)-N(3))-methyltransferase [Pyrinomonadaceae bacterium]
MHRFYAPRDKFAADTVTLADDEARHLRDVLRLKAGERIYVFDGEGGEFVCEIVEAGRRSATVRLVERVAPAAPESPLDLTLAAAILKGEKFDLVVQKAVELGIRRIVPLVTRRGDVKLKGSTGRVERWRRIALEAAKQSGRATLTAVDEPTDLQPALDDDRAAARLLFSERGGSPLDSVTGSGKMIAFIGPEGGWDDSELDAAVAAGVRIVTLGGRILRAETASIAISALLQNRFGDLR